MGQKLPKEAEHRNETVRPMRTDMRPPCAKKTILENRQVLMKQSQNMIDVIPTTHPSRRATWTRQETAR